VKRETAETIASEYLKPVFGFALKRCKNLQDAEDLSQEIVLKAFRALLAKDDIGDPARFIWTIAHNALSNYYRDAARGTIGLSFDEVEDTLADPDSLSEEDDSANAIRRLQKEIAYLSALQRKIVIAYYFENRRQADIASELGIPLGTVKWHLFEAKKELKERLGVMRQTSELTFNPIKFHSYGINGSVGNKKIDEFFRSALSQNICYCVRNEAKTVNEIADDLGVSPVYVEGEVDFLETYGFLKEEKGKVIVNFLISEPTSELLILQHTMYKKAAAGFASDLFDALTASELLDRSDLWCAQTDGPISLTDPSRADRNFLLWALIPFIISENGKLTAEKRISFDEVATIRPDGSHNIAQATVLPDRMDLPKDYVFMKNWCGPFRYPDKKHAAGNPSFWQLDSEWSNRRLQVSKAEREKADRVISLFKRENEEGLLSKDEYAWLAEQGFIKTVGDYDGSFKSSWQIVILATKDIRDALLAIGETIFKQHKDELKALKAPYIEAVLASVPAHLRKVKAYELQFLFGSDGWFILHCLVSLLNSGKLKPPTDGQKKALSTLLVQN